jgi:tetratricopeptide (TPR) repeat protein
MARYLSGRYQEAADAYLHSLAAGPDHAYSLLNLADAEVELGHPSQAQTLYRRVLDLYANNTNAKRGPADSLIEAAEAGLKVTPEAAGLVGVDYSAVQPRSRIAAAT